MFQWYSYVVQKKVYFSSPDNHDLLPTLSDTLGIFPWQTFFCVIKRDLISNRYTSFVILTKVQGVEVESTYIYYLPSGTFPENR